MQFLAVVGRGFFPRSEQTEHSGEERSVQGSGMLQIWTACEPPAELSASQSGRLPDFNCSGGGAVKMGETRKT